MFSRSRSHPLLLVLVLAAAGRLRAQQAPASPATPPAPATEPTAAPEVHGQVLFERHSGVEPTASAAQTAPPQTAPPTTGPELTDADRAALTVTAYDLDVRLSPASSQLAMRARLTVRNDGTAPLSRFALQVSSTLVWQSATLVMAGSRVPLAVAQHLVDTDADHTGKASEMILSPPTPLAPGASLTLDTFYAGTLPASQGRLERLGATPAQAEGADWDGIDATGTWLRGFGDVLWYPVSAPQLFLGDGARLFQAIGEMRLREQAASMHLQLAVEYRGEAPVAAYFCGRRQPLKALPDDADAPVAVGSGIATATFATEPLGFRLPSLFLLDHPETPVANGLLAVETSDEAALPRLADSAKALEPLLETWFGPHPLSALTVLDHRGQPFEDGPLLVAPVAVLGASGATEALAHSLTHAFVQTGQPWIDEGLAQFVGLLSTEQQQGREAATAELTELMRPVTLAEPTPEELATHPGQPLVHCSEEIYFRRKAAAVWWMLRSLAGDQPLAQALSAWRVQPATPAASEADAAAQAVALEHLLERTSGKDLGWFFADWVLRDRGLPDLTIVDVTPRQLPAGTGHDTGWLVAVTVRNEGAAAAEVPLILRSANATTTRSLRVPGLSTVTERAVLEAPPTEVQVNDGTVPEVRTSVHRRTIVQRSEP